MPSSASDLITANLLEDFDFTGQYLVESSKRLAESYTYVVNALHRYGIPFHPGSNSGFFVWIQLQPSPSKKLSGAPDRIAQHLWKHKVFLEGGTEYGAEEEGWFRFIFSQDRRCVDEALRRIGKAMLEESDGVIEESG